MPGSSTTPGWPSARVGALGHIAFHYTDSVGTRDQFSIAAQWLACTFPYRRFADILADACARLGADVDCYSFIAVDLHHLLLAGRPAHLCENAQEATRQRIIFSIALFPIAATALFLFRLTKSRRNFYAQIECLCFHTALYGNTSVKVHPARSSPFLLVQYERSEGSPLAGAMRATTLYSVEST